MKNAKLMIIATAALVAACGPGDNNGKGTNNGTGGTNNGTNVGSNNGTGGTNNGTTPGSNNGTTPGSNNGTTAGSNNGTTGGPNNDFGTEMEPNDETANVVAVGEAFSGRADEEDVDLFSLDLTAGTILTVTVTSAGTADALVGGLIDPSGEIEREIVMAAGATRQFFIAEDGAHLFSVFGIDGASTYEITTAVDTMPAATDLTIPGMQDAELDGNAVDVYSWTADSDDMVTVETFAERAPTESDLDTILYVWNPTNGVLVANDDSEDDPDGTFDSKGTFTATSGQEYWIVVDAYGYVPDGDHSYQLVTTLSMQ